MLKRLKIIEHRHTGRLKQHEHTSYIALGLILLIAIMPLIVYTANAESPGPQAGSVGISGVMPGKAPTTAATIKLPTEQQRFTVTPITVTGTCPENTLVELFKNDIFAGSTPCSSTGTYSLDIDLLIGANKLVAKVYDALNQPGPDSNIVNIYYDAMPTQASSVTSLNFDGAQLLLNTSAVFRGVFPNQELNVPITILGGTPPYAVNIQWGDSTNKVISRNDNIEFNAAHTYAKAGTYQVTLQASDATGRVAFLTIAVIVNGEASTANAGTISTATTNQLLVMWPLYAAAVAVVISFWLGEQREKRVLRTRNIILHS